jgi:hypothetical protein
MKIFGWYLEPIATPTKNRLWQEALTGVRKDLSRNIR